MTPRGPYSILAVLAVLGIQRSRSHRPVGAGSRRQGSAGNGDWQSSSRTAPDHVVRGHARVGWLPRGRHDGQWTPESGQQPSHPGRVLPAQLGTVPITSTSLDDPAGIRQPLRAGDTLVVHAVVSPRREQTWPIFRMAAGRGTLVVKVARQWRICCCDHGCDPTHGSGMQGGLLARPAVPAPPSETKIRQQTFIAGAPREARQRISRPRACAAYRLERVLQVARPA
jgi:hypothetical protein